MSLDTFKNQTISHRITRIGEDGKKTALNQTVTMTAPTENGELIRVTSQNDGSCVALVERNEGKYFLNLSSTLFAGEGSLPFADKKIEILEHPVFPPISLGAGLEDELIVSVSFGDGKEGQVKIAPTSVTVTYEGKTYTSSTVSKGYCFDMSLSASVVEGMFERTGHDSHFFRTPVIFGRGEKCPPYLLGMYASQIPDNETVSLGDVRLFKVKTDSMREPIVFFGQKNDLFLYNKGKIERATSHHFARDERGNVSLAIERVGDVSYLKVPLGIIAPDANVPVETKGCEDILRLFAGYALPYKQGETSSNEAFALPSQLSPIPEDARKWTQYQFAYKPLSQRVSGKGSIESAEREISFQVVVFTGSPIPYCVNQTFGRIFTVTDGKISWQNYKDFASLIEKGDYRVSPAEIAIKKIGDKTILVDKINDTYRLLADDNATITDISKEEYERLLNEAFGKMTTEPPREADPSKVRREAPVSDEKTREEEPRTEEVRGEEPADEADPRHGVAEEVVPERPIPHHERAEDSVPPTSEPSELVVTLENGGVKRSYVVNLLDRNVVSLDAPETPLTFDDFIYDARSNTDFLQKISDWNGKVPKPDRVDYVGIIREMAVSRGDKASEEAGATGAGTPTSGEGSSRPVSGGAEVASSAGKKPEEKKPAESKPEPSKPVERKVDHKKRAETLSTIAMGLGLFATLVGAIFAPWLVVVGLIATIGGGFTNAYSDLFKYSVFSSVKPKIAKAEKTERELERDSERIAELDRTYDEAERSAIGAGDGLRELCDSEIGDTDTTAELFKTLCDEYGMRCPTYGDDDAIMDLEHLADADNLGALSYRTGLVEQMDAIAGTSDPEVRAQLIDNFFSANFTAVPEEKRKEFSAIFENNASLGNLRNSLQAVNTAQQTMQETLERQREYFADEKRGTARIARATKSLSGEEQIKFFERYSDVIAYEMSRHPEKVAVVIEKALQNVGEENREQVIAILDNAQRRISYALDDTITAVAREHDENVKQLESARAYTEVMSAGEGIERAPLGQMLSIYTRGVYNYNLTEQEGDLYGFVHGVDESALDGDERAILDAVKQAVSSSSFEGAVDNLTRTMASDKIETKIADITESGLATSILPKASDANFHASKSVFAVARAIAQSEIDAFDREYLIMREKRTGSEYVVRRSKPKLKLRNSAEILASRERSKGVVSASQYANLIVSQESLNQTNVLLEVAKTISDLDSTITAEEVATKMEELKTSPLRMSDDDLAIVAKAKIIAEKRRTALTGLVTGSREEEATIGEKASLYANVSTLIDVAMSGRLTDVRIANAYDSAMGEEHEKTSYSPAECSASEQEHEFNRKFNAYLATLPPEEQEEIYRALDERASQSAQDKCEVLAQITGQKVINVSGLTYQRFVESQTSEGKINLELANDRIAEMREQESERTRRQMLPQEDRFAGIRALNGDVLRDALVDKCARLNGAQEKYETVIDWITSTQKIDRDTILASFEKILREQGNLSNSGLTTALFEELGIDSAETQKQFRADRRNIKSLKLKKSVVTFERQEAKDRLALQEAKTEMAFKSSFDSICEKISAEGLSTSNYVELSSLINSPEYQTVIAKLGIYPEMLEGVLTNPEAKENATRQLAEIRGGQVYADFAHRVEAKSGLVSTKTKGELDSLVTKHEALTINAANYIVSANEFLSIIEKETAISREEMVSAVKYLMDPAHADFVRDTFGEEYLEKVKELPTDFEHGDVDDIYNKFVSSRDVAPASEEGASPASGKIRERIETVMSSKTETVAELETAIINSDTNAEERFELLKLRKQKELYSKKAEEFNSVYSQFIEHPDMRVMQQALLSFVKGIENQDFLAISGLSSATFERLISECESSSKAKEIATIFETKNNLTDVVSRGEKRLNDKENDLLTLQNVTSQEEIDDIEEKRSESVIAGNAFNSQFAAVESLPEEAKANGINNLFKYYALVSRLNQLENISHDSPSSELFEEMEAVEQSIDQLKAESLEYLPLPLDSFDIEGDRMFAGQMYFSYDYFSEMVEDDIPPIDPTLTGKAKQKALAKRKKLLAKRSKALQKNMKAVKANVKSRQEEMRKEREARKRKLEQEKKKQEVSVPEAKKGLSILGKIFGNMARKQKLAKGKAKSAPSAESVRTSERAPAEEARDGAGRATEEGASRE